MRYFILLSMLFISGCSSFINNDVRIENYKEILNAWINHPKEELISVWGMPVHTYEKNKIEYVIYIESDVVAVSNGNKIDRMPVDSASSFLKKNPALVNKSCTTIFMLEKDKVTGWRFEGNSCLTTF